MLHVLCATVCTPPRRPLVSVVVDPCVGDKLRPHQREGVQFLYDCVSGARVRDYNGCILADDMGLGKSIQVPP